MPLQFQFGNSSNDVAKLADFFNSVEPNADTAFLAKALMQVDEKQCNALMLAAKLGDCNGVEKIIAMARKVSGKLLKDKCAPTSW